jgi:ABC-type uncharacterized transport system substrate-binding protein
VDLIVSEGTQGVTAARNATQTIPIVMITVRDPVGTGLIASLACHSVGSPVSGCRGSSDASNRERFALFGVLMKANVQGNEPLLSYT